MINVRLELEEAGNGFTDLETHQMKAKAKAPKWIGFQKVEECGVREE